MSLKFQEDHRPNKKAEGLRKGARFGIILARRVREKISQHFALLRSQMEKIARTLIKRGIQPI